MILANGTRPIEPHKQQRSLPRTFGTIAASTLPDEFDTDAGLVVPDQNAEGRPYGCTGYTVTELGNDEDNAIYDPGFNYDLTREMEGTQGQDVGCDLKDAFKSATVYGLLTKSNPGNPLENRRAPYYEVHPHDGLDYFDSIRSAMIVAYQLDNKKHGTGNGTFWLPEWANPQNGLIPGLYLYDGVPDHYAWHAWNFKGWMMKNGQLRLKAKMHQGPNYGEGGFAWFTRTQVNKIFAEWGTIILMQVKAEPKDIKYVKYTILETAVRLATQILKRGGYKEAFTSLVAILKLLKV